MKSEIIRQKFLDFFREKGHAVVPSSSLVPDDPSVLLTTAGMQQFKKYFTGELDPQKDFGAKNTVSVQKCFRTSDIDEVGDESHLTFFEMLGNFSFGYKPGEPGSPKGGYWKKEAIKYAYEFIISVMGLEIDYVTVFDPSKVSAGDWRAGVPFDGESYEIWKKYLPESKIRREGADNFWGPTGAEGPCGPTAEIYVDGIEIWNIVFNQFYCDASKKLIPLKIQGIDTGMGLERLAMVIQKKKNIFETDLFFPLFEILPVELPEREKRIIVDHLRGSIFLLADEVRPSNKEAGYVLRRLMRRVFVYEMKIPSDTFEKIIESAILDYCLFYPWLEKEKTIILDEFNKERGRFIITLSKGVKELNSLKKRGSISAIDAFRIYETHGLPYEAIKDLGGENAKNLTRGDFEKEFKKHQEISRAGAEKKFGGHGLLLDTGELKAKNEEELKKVTRLHTATHLLQAALRKILGPDAKQAGSDITGERTRFDFAFPRKLVPEELREVERAVNDAIQQDLPVRFKEMPKEEAEETGALYFFKQKYPERVKVYYAGRTLEDAFSKEFCGGPHVTHTGEIGAFKIVKEEAVGAGVRRIRGTVEP